MASSDDDQLNKNSFLFISVRKNRNIKEKIENITKCLKRGADINAADGNNNNNTPIHVAVSRGETDIVRLLIDNGAALNVRNSSGETPLTIVQQLKTDNKQEILNLLQAADKPANSQPLKKKPTQAEAGFKYLKRTGTSGVCGQLYETKLLSLVLLRALKNNNIEEFHLGTNISGIGALDDICLRCHVKGQQKPMLILVQAKHREDREKGKLTVEDVESAAGDFSLRKYLDSYLKIKDRFKVNNEDVMFEGEFSNAECNLIIYTPAKEHFTKKNTTNKVSPMVHYLINTGKETEVFQYKHEENDIDFLTKLTVLERIKNLGSTFIHSIMADGDKSDLMQSDLIVRYHVVIGREVLQPAKLQQENQQHRMWQFRPDFFTSNCEYLITLMDIFYKELVTIRFDKSAIVEEDRSNVELILELTSDASAFTISKLIGKLVTYEEKKKVKKLKLILVKDFIKLFKADYCFETLQERFNKIEIDENVIREAIRMKLESIKFKLPLAFGNLDMTIRGTEPKVKKRLKTIADKMISLFQSQKTTQTIEINENIVGPGKTLEQGFVDINGGIGSSVGNLLVFDTETKTMKFDMENATLPSKADLLLNELKNALKDDKDTLISKDLSSYRFKININGFPKDTFHGDEYDKSQARDFLSKLWFYTNQEKEDEVEDTLKKYIEEYYNKENTFKIHSDAIFLTSHDEIQKWWMKPGQASYLNRSSDFFELAKLAVIDTPLLTVLNFMYNLKLQNIGIKFNIDAINSLELDKITKRVFNVITKVHDFSGIKIMQYFEKLEKYTFIDFNYVLSLPLNDYNTMILELKETKIETLIIVYETLKYYEGLCSKLHEVIELFKGGKIVIVTDNNLAEDIKKYFGVKYRSVRDDKTYLIDLNETSQTKILEESTIVFQGEELPLKCVSYQNARSLVSTDVLKKLINKENIEIGRALMDQIYNDIKDRFIDRSLTDDDTYPVNTLEDIEREIVVVTGRPGMGKSALLTHLSLKTKLDNPLPWIVRVNLPDYEKVFSRWQEQDMTISIPLTMHFLCTIALKNIDTQKNLELDHIEGNITVSHVEEDIDPVALFELELFLYLYNCGKIIFLFDDFNAMCPHYEKEVINIFKLLKDEGTRMWITTCSYRHTRIALENEFGSSYRLDPFHADQKKVYLERFFRTNLRLERLNYDQFENVRSFMKFMSKFTNMELISDPDRELLPLFSLTFHLIYVLAVQFFQSEINRASASTIRAKFRENFEIDLDQYTSVDELLGRSPDDEELELSGTPLHLYVAANYFKFRIEDSISFLLGEQEVKNKWDLVLNTVTLYQHYIEAHMKRIFFKEDGDDDSVISTYNRIRKEFLEKHKKLGLFTICRENDLKKFLKPEEISEVQTTISKIQSGEDRSSLVNCVVNEVPRFAHLVFAEYFAVECLTDIMKSVVNDTEQNPFMNASLWQSILNILLFKAPPGVRKAFDYKLQSDGALAKLTNSEVCREVIFELLLKQDRRVTEVNDEGEEMSDTPVSDALEDGLTNIVNLLLSSTQGHLNRGNVDEILSLFKRTGEKFVDFGKEYAETMNNLLDSVKEMDVTKLADILKSGRLTDVPLRHESDYCHSETATELQRQVVATTSQLPELAQHVQQLFQRTDSVGQVLTSLAKLGVKTLVDEVLTTIKPPDPELD